MRWLLISAQHHPTQGGIGTYVSQFVAAAADAGWTVGLVTRPSNVLPQRAAIHELLTHDQDASFASRLDDLRTIERIRPFRYALWSRAVAEFLLKIEPDFDAVEFVDCQAEGFAALCSPRVRRRWAGIPMIIHAHTPMFLEEQINGGDPSRFGRTIYHQWERRALQAADGIIVTSQLLGEHMPADVPRAVIPYPIMFDSGIPKFAQRRDEILFVGSIQPRKGVDVWARSLSEVFRQAPHTTAAMIGPDTPTSPDGTSMANHVLRLILPEYAHRFSWLGAIAHQEVVQRIARAALVVVPSVFESFSFVAAEALALGTPVIVSDRVGIAEPVTDLPQCPAGDVAAWAEAQSALLVNQTHAREIARHGRRQLQAACAPQRHFRTRADFVRQVHAARPAKVSRAEGSRDALDELDEFIAETEGMEAALTSCSSVRS